MRCPRPVSMPSDSNCTTASKSLRSRRAKGAARRKRLNRSSSHHSSAAATSATTCWARMSSGATGITVASRSPDRTDASRAAHSTNSSRVSGKTMASGTPASEWLDRPARWSMVAMLRGEPTWHTSSTGPMSMPSSSEAVATKARSSPARRRSSTRSRRSLDRLPWWAATSSAPSRSPSRWASRSDIRRVLTNTRVVRWPRTCSAIWSMTSPNCSVDATAPSSLPGTSTERWRSRRCPQSTIAVGCDSPDSGSMPVRSSATRSIGRWVAERPMRCGRRSPRLT